MTPAPHCRAMTGWLTSVHQTSLRPVLEGKSFSISERETVDISPPPKERLPLTLIWVIVWLTCLIVSGLLFAWAVALRPDRLGTRPGGPDWGGLCLALCLAASVLTFLTWQSRQRPRLYCSEPTPPAQPWRDGARFLILLAMPAALALLAGHSVSTQWPGVVFLTLALYGAFVFLSWWVETQLPPVFAPVTDPLAPPAAWEVIDWPLQPSRYLIRANDREMVFGAPVQGQGCMFLLSLPLILFSGWGAYYFFLSVPAVSGARSVRIETLVELIIWLLAVVSAAFLAVLILGSSGPNTIAFNLENGTYMRMMYAPLRFAECAELGFGVPFRVVRLTGPLDHLAGIYVSEYRGKNDDWYSVRVAWNDSRQPPVCLGRFRDAAEARAQMLAVAARLGVAALGRCPK